ncbi:MAG: hypothetical protein NVSMB51_09910 [Solirubrobacteraceae bacterium]
MGKLDTYAAKRDFTRTPEPPGAKAGVRPDERFVVQEHHARRLHWDLRFERDGVLASWAVPNGIPTEPGQNRIAIRTEDHPLQYIDFEGEIPAGSYGAGTMRIWDTGSYECEKFTDEKVVVRFHGARLRGAYALFRTHGADWMIHRMDPPERSADPLPAAKPMLATLAQSPPDTGDWAYEVKWDGIRALARCEPGRVTLLSRNGGDISGQYPEVRGLARALGSRPVLLDGELIAFGDDGRPSFERLQNRMNLTSAAQIRRRAAATPVLYAIFDLLYLDGRDVTSLTYRERRALLDSLALDGPAWRTPAAQDVGLLQATAAQGLEGVLAKRLDSPYEPGRRSRNWLKLKHTRRAEFIVGGWLPGKGSRGELGALLLGEAEADGALRYVGRVGSGFSEAELARLTSLLAPLQRERSPFTAGRRPPAGAIWAAPELSVEVRFSERTRERMLRHPVYGGLRERPVALSNPSKVLYPQSGFSKTDLVEYLTALAPVLLPHLRGRPLTMKRYPDGVEGKAFYEKRCPEHRPAWVQTSPPLGREAIPYCLVEDLPTLLWAANLAALELHVPLARAADIRTPTALVFDLDPGAPAAVEECAQVALWLRELFSGLDLACVVKTSGSKGLQLYVPLNSEVSYERTKTFARAVAETLEQAHPELVVSRMNKRLRAGKVFIDWSQNDEHKTTVAVYSLRAMTAPTVSTPVRWEEIEGGARLSFEAHELPARVARHGDLFAPLLTCRQSLPTF